MQKRALRRQQDQCVQTNWEYQREKPVQHGKVLSRGKVTRVLESGGPHTSSGQSLNRCISGSPSSAVGRLSAALLSADSEVPWRSTHWGRPRTAQVELKGVWRAPSKHWAQIQSSHSPLIWLCCIRKPPVGPAVSFFMLCRTSTALPPSSHDALRLLEDM